MTFTLGKKNPKNLHRTTKFLAKGSFMKVFIRQPTVQDNHF